LLSCNLDSEIYISNVQLVDSIASFIRVTSSYLTIDELSTSNVTFADNMLKMINSYDLSFTNSHIQDAISDIGVLIFISRSHISEIRNLTVTDLPHQFIYLERSTVALIDGMYLHNITNGIEIFRTNVTLLTNSEFDMIGSKNHFKGGVIFIKRSSISIDNSTFTNNQAIKGGALKIEWFVSSHWVNSFTNSVFINNTAIQQGGAIAYDLYRPTMENLTYEGNTAPYGQNVASYPIRVIMQGNSNNEITVDNVGSGITYPSVIKLALIDYDRQEITIENTTQIKITSRTAGSSVSGVDYAVAVGGVGTFDNLNFKYKPGVANVTFSVTSKAINLPRIAAAYELESASSDISVNFRYCKPGERQNQDDTCSECDQGTYSLFWNSTTCEKCMDDVVCLGKTEIEVNPGFWRNTLNSTNIVDCPREDSCTGGYVFESTHPVNWSAGYSGFLCTECELLEGEKFQRVGLYECEKCPDPTLNVIRVIGFMLLIIFFIVILIIVNIKKKKESQLSILLRIFTNYLQLIATAMSFNLQYPSFIVEMFYPVEKVGSTSESFLSFDWFFEDTEVKAFTPSTVIFKMFLSGLLPIIIVMIVIVIWTILYCTKHRWFTELKRNIVISIICIMFLLHPTLTKQALVIFQWTEIDDNEQRVTIDMSIKCYSDTHMFWSLWVGIPMIVFWVFGAPLLVLFILTKNRNNLQEPYMKRYFLVLYQGLKKKTYYWEFVNTLRKMLMPALSVVLATFPAFYRAMVAIIILVILFRIQQYLHPYKMEENNQIEMLAVITGLVTLFGAIIFIDTDSETDVEFLKLFSLIVIILVNSYFILRWLHLLLYAFRYKHGALLTARKILGIALFRNKDQ